MEHEFSPLINILNFIRDMIFCVVAIYHQSNHLMSVLQTIIFLAIKDQRPMIVKVRILVSPPQLK